jgi:hypothetical protein
MMKVPIIGGLIWDTHGMKAPFVLSIFIELLLIPIYIIAVRKIWMHLETKKPKVKPK